MHFKITFLFIICFGIISHSAVLPNTVLDDDTPLSSLPESVRFKVTKNILVPANETSVKITDLAFEDIAPGGTINFGNSYYIVTGLKFACALIVKPADKPRAIAQNTEIFSMSRAIESNRFNACTYQACYGLQTNAPTPPYTDGIHNILVFQFQHSQVKALKCESWDVGNHEASVGLLKKMVNKHFELGAPEIETIPEE
jgi:hypothetical protein